MARLAGTGFEVGFPIDTQSATAPSGMSLDGTIFRSGAKSLKVIAASGVQSSVGLPVGVGGAVFARIYVRITALPSSGSRILIGDVFGGAMNVRINSLGKLEIYDANTLIATGTATLTTTTQWYRVEWKATPQLGDTAVYVDGVGDSTWGSLSASTAMLSAVGPNDTGTATYTAYFDDWITDDTALPGAGAVVLSLPISDNARGGWTGGAGGTTNLFDAVNNIPPVGVAVASETNTSQIKNAVSSTTDNCDFNMQSYTTVGVPAGATVNTVWLIAAHGEEIATGTKAGAIKVVSNPAQVSENSFNFGNDSATIAAAYPTGWPVIVGSMVSGTGVVLGTSPVARIGKRTATTRLTDCCFLGMYIDYSPAAGASATPSPATSAWTALPPAVTPGAITATPPASTAAWTSPTPAVTKALTTAAPVSTSTWVANSPTVTPGTVAATPLAATSSWVALTPSATTPVIGTPAAAVSSWVTPTPTGTRALTLATPASVSSWVANSPSVALGTVTGAPPAATGTWNTLTPARSLALTVTTNAAVSTWTTNTPSISMTFSATPTVATSAWVTNTPIGTRALSLTPIPATSSWTANGVTGTRSLTLSSTAATSSWVANAPSVSAAISTSAAVSTWTANAPAVARSLTLASTTATSTWVAPSPSVSAALSLPSTAAVSSWIANAPSVAAGNVTATPSSTSSSWITNAPTPAAGSVSLSSSAASSTWTTNNPSGATALSLTPSPATATWIANDVTLNVVVGTPTTAAVSTWVANAPSVTIGLTTLPAVSSWVTNSPSVSALGSVGATVGQLFPRGFN